MIDPDKPAPLPPSIVPQRVHKGDGTDADVVTVIDAARLVGMKVGTIDAWIAEGKLAICYTPEKERRVFVDSLWRALPLELRR